MVEPKDLIKSGKEHLRRGDWEMAAKVFGQAIDDIGPGPMGTLGNKVLAEALRLRAFALSRIGETEEAITLARRALDISSGLGDIEGEAEALRRLGYVHTLRSDLSTAMELYGSALDKAEECGARVLEATTKIEVGNVFNIRGELDRARDTYQEAISILREEGEMNELARAHNNLGDCYIRMGHLDEAIEVLRQCMDIATEIGDTTIKGWAAFNAAECFTKMGEPLTAREYLELALEHLEKADDRIGVACTFMVYGINFTATEEWPLAEEAFKKALIMMRELEMPSKEAEVLREIGRMYIARGEADLAKGNLRMALDIFKRAGQGLDAQKVEELISKL